MKRRHKNAPFTDWKAASTAARAESKKQGRLVVARKVPGGYILAAVSRPKSNPKRPRRVVKKRPNPDKASIVLREFYAGKLKDSHGRKVKKLAQAKAIAMSEARQSGKLSNRKKGPYRKYRDRSLFDKALAKFSSAPKRNRPKIRRRARRRNPDSSFIGSAPTLWAWGGQRYDFPRGVLRASPNANGVYLDLGGATAPPVGAKIKRIEYDDPVKALEAYKEIGRFRHDCKDPFVVSPAQDGKVLLSSKTTAWRLE